MYLDKLRSLLESVEAGNVSVDDAMGKLRSLPYEDLGFAKIDNHRALRTGYPEVIFCQSKTFEQVTKIISKMSEDHKLILGMRATLGMYEAVCKVVPNTKFNDSANALIVGNIPEPKNDKSILVISAGTADLPVAEEAAVTAEAMGNKVERIFDAGIAGVHRILDKHEQLIKANVLVVVAGMEGALPGLVGGLVDKPVIAVPTSVGYGASFNGLSAMLTMLNSCVPGISVVNIDNGFGAGYTAGLINDLSRAEK